MPMHHVFKTFSTLMTQTVHFILPFLATFVNFWLWCNKINNLEQTTSYHYTIRPSNEVRRANLMLGHFCGKAFTWSFRQIQKNITTNSNDSKLAIYHHSLRASRIKSYIFLNFLAPCPVFMACFLY